MRNLHLQNLPERIEKLKRHIKTRRGRRDFKALGTLCDIADALKGVQRKASTLRSMDAILKQYYDEECGFLASYAERMRSPFFSFVKKDENCPPDRFYIVSTLEDTVVKARCPDCDTLQEITPNGADPKKTNRRQRICVHKKPNEPELCLGSGKDV